MERRVRYSRIQLGMGDKESPCGSWAGSHLPGWVARAMVGADQILASDRRLLRKSLCHPLLTGYLLLVVTATLLSLTRLRVSFTLGAQ